MLSPTTNIAAIVAKRNLAENALQATRSISKVSQGTRIVKPMDDATSLSVSNTIRTSLAGMNQGVRNTTQGSSLLQVAAGGLEQTSQMLTRMKQLAVQVINDTLGSAEISYANEEFGQLMQQIDSTAEQTRFSGKSLLTGGRSQAVYSNRGLWAHVPNVNTNTATINTTAFAFTTSNGPGIIWGDEYVEPSPLSSGLVVHKFPDDAVNINIETLDNEIRVEFEPGVYYRASYEDIEPLGTLKLKSEIDENNVLALQLSDDVSSIQQVSDLAIHLKQFLVGSEFRIGESKHVKFGNADNTFRLDNNSDSFDDRFVNTAKTHGIVTGTVLNADNMEFFEDGNGNWTVTMIMGNETYRATDIRISPAETIDFISDTNSGNRFSLRFHPTDTSFIGTAGQFDFAFRNTFIHCPAPIDTLGYDGTFRLSGGLQGGIAGVIATDTRSRFDLFSGELQGQVSDINVTGPTDGFYDARIKIGDKQFRAITEGLNGGDIEFIGTQNSDNKMTIGFNRNITDADDLRDSLQLHFGEVVFEIAGSGLVVGDPPQVSLDNSNSITNGFSGFNTFNSKGFINGIAQDVEVLEIGEGVFDIKLVVGNQTFRQHHFDSNNVESLILISETDPDNVISYTVGPFDSVNRFNTYSGLKTSLENLFGLDERGSSAPVRFNSASAANNGYNGVSMSRNEGSILTGAGSEPGVYAVSYNAETRIAKLTNGAAFYEKTLSPDDIIDGKVTVDFGNSLSLQLGNDVSLFDINSSISQMVFEIESNDSASLEFQVSDISRDDMSIQMEAATVKNLKLTGSSINGKDLARDAQDKIDLAITAINTGLANIGAQQSRFEFVRVNLTIQMENTTAARATYYDVDMGGEITEFTKYQTLTQAATSMLSQANELPQELLRLLP